MVILRLARFGAKKKPFYRIVAADSRGKRDGRFIELLGTYNPLTDPIVVTLDMERVEYWQSVGAQTSSTVKRLIEIRREVSDGVIESPKALKKKARIAKKEAEKASEKQPAVEEKPVEAAPEKPAVEEKPVEAAPEKPAVEEKPVEAAPEKPAVEEKPVEAAPEKPAVEEKKSDTDAEPGDEQGA